FVTLPFVTTVDAGFNDSTILGNIGQTNPSILLATQFRRSLANQAETRAILDSVKTQINQLRPISDRGMIYAHLVAHFVSDDYKPYLHYDRPRPGLLGQLPMALEQIYQAV